MSEHPDIICFGGAFDPIHVGHMESVKIAQDAFPEARMLVIPSFAPPVSAGTSKNVETPFADRLAMTVVAFDEWPRVFVSSIEEDLDRPNYTFATLEALAAEHPASRIAWMIGTDQLEAFTSWKNPRRILELASLVVIPRAGAPVARVLETASHVASSLGFSAAIDAARLRLDLDGGGSIYVLERSPAPVSSTEIRKLASKNLHQINGLVATSVMDYIADIGLYQNVPD